MARTSITHSSGRPPAGLLAEYITIVEVIAEFNVTLDAYGKALANALAGQLAASLKSNPNHDERGRFAGGGAASALSDVQRDPQVTSPDAQSKVDGYVARLPKEALAESSLREVWVYDNPEDAQGKIDEIVGDREDATGARGVYDRSTGTMVSTLWISEDSEESGRNFYHEFAHTLEDRITSPGWEKAWHEWSDYGQDEGFAEAFSSYMVDDRTDFAEAHPASATMFAEWGW